MRRALLCGMLVVCWMSCGAQPVFNYKTVEIVKRPAVPMTKAGDLMTASVVTLHLHDAPVRDVLAAFAKQIDAGVTIEGTNDGFAQLPSMDWVESARVSVNVVRAGYWDALVAVLKAMPVRLDPQAREGMLVLVEHPGGADVSPDALERRFVLAMLAAPGTRRVGALLLTGQVLSRNFAGTNETRLVVGVAVEPRVWGVSALAVLRLSALNGADGRSLLGERHEFVTTEDHSWSNEYARWGFDLGDASKDEVKVKELRGELRVAAGKDEKGTFDLSGMFTPTPPVPGEVQVNEECQIFRAPNFAVARGTYTSRDRRFPDECRVVNSNHEPGVGRRPTYTESRTLVMHNVTDQPETFVVWTTFPPDQARFTSLRKPEVVQNHGEYRVYVAPHETERLHIAYEVNQSRKIPQPLVADVPFAPKKLWQQVTVGETRLTVKAVVPQEGEYVLRAEFSSAADGPVKYACLRYCQMLSLHDAQERQIPGQAAFGPNEQKDGREVMEWSLTTAGRGLVPAKLEWELEGATSWVKVAVK